MSTLHAAAPVVLAAAGRTDTPEAVAFWILAPIMVLSAIGMLVVRKAVHSALLLAVTMVSLAILYIGQDAPFLGVVQVVVYTGAVMMLFLFVLMLVGVDSSDSHVETIRGQRIASVLAGLGFAILLISALGRMSFPGGAKGLADANAGGNQEGIAALLFQRYVYVFEVTSALLIVAAMGAMVLAHRERHTPRVTQRTRSLERFRPGNYPAPLPPPGTYARHNAVDTPALLPDGTPSELSVPALVSARGEAKPGRYAISEAGAIERTEAPARRAPHDGLDR